MSAQTMDRAVDEVVGTLEKPKRRGKKMIVLIALPVLLLGVGGGLYMSGMLDGLLGGGNAAEGEAGHAEAGGEEAGHGGSAATASEHESGGGGHGEPGGASQFFDIPDILVNLASDTQRQHFLKMSVSLELGSPDDTAKVQQVLPRIVDNVQVYLRELRIDDLRGSAGLQRLREELLRRVNDAAYPAQIRDVLFREMLVQ